MCLLLLLTPHYYILYGGFIVGIIQECRASLTQMVKNLPATQETQVQSLGPEDPLEKEMATNSSILIWRIPRTEEPGGIQSMVSRESDMIE